MTKEEELMKLTIVEAKKSIVHKEWPGGVIIAKQEKILERAENYVQRNYDPTAHAEIVAIRNLCKKLATWNLEGCELYSTAEPCPMCMAACIWAGVLKIYYGVSLKDLVKKGDYQIKIYSEEFAQKSF